MSGDVDHVVSATEDEEVAVLVPDAPVERRIDVSVRNRGPVGLDEALVVAPDRRHASRWQWAFDRDHAFFVVTGDLFAGRFVVELDRVAVGGHPGRTELRWQRFDAPLEREDRATRLRLSDV